MGLYDIDPRLLLGLGGRLLSASGQGMNLQQGLGGAILGGMQDYSAIMQEAQAKKRQDLQNELLQKNLDRMAQAEKDEADRKARFANIMKENPPQYMGLTGIRPNTVKGDAFMPGLAGTSPEEYQVTGDAFLPQRGNFGMIDNQAGLAGALKQEALRQAFETGDVSTALAAITPEKPDLSPGIKEFLQAQELGLSNNPAYRQFMQDKKQTIQTQPPHMSVSELQNFVDAQGNPPHPATTRQELGAGIQSGQFQWKQKAPTSGDAGKKALLDSAQAELANIAKYSMEGDKWNQQNISDAYWMSKTGMLGEWQFGDTPGANLYNATSAVIETVIRVTSGAEAPEPEVNRAMKRFMATPWDNDSLKMQKFKALELFVNNADRYLNPNDKGQKVVVDYVRAMQDAKAAIENRPAATIDDFFR